jgi:hypothetical protein
MGFSAAVSMKAVEKDKVFAFRRRKTLSQNPNLSSRECSPENPQPYSREPGAAGKKPDRSRRPVRFQSATKTKNACPAQAKKAGAKPEKPYE